MEKLDKGLVSTPIAWVYSVCNLCIDCKLKKNFRKISKVLNIRFYF